MTRTVIGALIAAAAAAIAGCAPGNPPSAVPITTTTPVRATAMDVYITELERIYHRPVVDRSALITAAFDICTQIRRIHDPELYRAAIAAFSDGATMPVSDGEQIINAAMLFACPSEYQRTESYR